jgi:Fe-S cluster assembly protein SufD
VTPPPSDLPAVVERAREPGLDPVARLIHVDGTPQPATVHERATEGGLLLTDIDDAAANHAGLLRPHLGALVGAQDYFSARSLARFRGGAFLFVPAGLVVQRPVQLMSWIDGHASVLEQRNVLVVEPEARVAVIDLYSSASLEQPTLCAPTTELFLGKGAQVQWVTWQALGKGTSYLAHLEARLDRDARLDAAVVTMGADFSRTRSEVQLAGEGAHSVMLGATFPVGQQVVEHWTVQDHLAAHTVSDLLYKGALSGRARSLYFGTIHIRNGARRCDAYQANRNLVLSSGAKADTNPHLEIENNDVRCTHGSTVGPLDEDQLFYLMSRGISRGEAERLVVQGFFHEVAHRMSWSGMGETLGQAIAAKMEERT